MNKKIEYNDLNESPEVIETRDDSNVIISNITNPFFLALSDFNGRTIEMEILVTEGGPVMRPRIPR